MNTAWLDEIKWSAEGLVPAIAQEAGSGRVLMMAWMNREALAETAASGRAVYWSRSRNKLWRKGEESGHVQRVKEMRLDCDADVILLTVEQAGGIACHTGRRSCFFRRFENGEWRTTDPVVTRRPRFIRARTVGGVLTRLAEVLETRKGADPASSYVAGLYAKGLEAILKKIGEEATETVMAAKDGAVDKIVRETADLWFHTLVLLAQQGLHPQDVLAELERRFGLSGVTEKARRPVG